MNILEKITQSKKREIALKKQLFSTNDFEKSPLFDRKTVSLKRCLLASPGIIAEHKRRSPSKAVINQSLAVEEIVSGYAEAGVSAISVLTDGQYFGGSLDDLLLARAAVSLPLLRKDFMIDPYQILEAKAFGADLILLIAAILQPNEINQMALLAKSLGLEVLLEVHNREELDYSLTPEIDFVGVNNRNLKTFEVSLDTSKELAAYIPDAFLKISESGLSNPESVKTLLKHGYRGFLMGEHFMKTPNPGAAAADFCLHAFGENYTAHDA